MIRAVIVDVYRTLLDVGPPPRDAVRLWTDLFRTTFSRSPDLSLAELSARCRRIVGDDHRLAEEHGVESPEVDWPSVLSRALEQPELSPEFVFQHAQLVKTVRLADGAKDFLVFCRKRRLPCGIASNAQAYTVMELHSALGTRLDDFFERELSFWSYEQGFSKPNRAVFRFLKERLRAIGITTGECLMIGDREDNDIIPARDEGFVTWHYGFDGGWKEAVEWLQFHSAQDKSQHCRTNSQTG